MNRAICNCETCNNKGWIETFAYNSDSIIDGTLIIEKCDDCNIFLNDYSAAKFVFDKYQIFSYRNENGFYLKIDFSLN
jgi:hypothetical protein